MKQEFLERLIKDCGIGEAITKDTDLMEYLNINSNEETSYEELSQMVFAYYMMFKNPKHLVYAERLGVPVPEEEKKTVVGKYAQRISRVLDEETISHYGIDLIDEIINYNTDAIDSLIEFADDDNFLKWVEFLKRMPDYNERILHGGLILYQNPVNRELANELISSDDEISEEELANLEEMIENRLHYYEGKPDLSLDRQVRNRGILKEYRWHKFDFMGDWLRNRNEKSKDLLIQALFGADIKDAQSIVKSFDLENPEYVDKKYVKSGVLSEKEIKQLELLSRILNARDIGELTRIYNEIMQTMNNCNTLEELLENLPGLRLPKLEEKLRTFCGERVSESLFDIDNIPEEGAEKSEVLVEGKTIPVITLNGAKFNMMIHTPSLGGTARTAASYGKKAPTSKKDTWEKYQGASFISTSIIGDNDLESRFGGSAQKVFFGFSGFPGKSIINMSYDDAGTLYEYRPLSVETGTAGTDKMKFVDTRTLTSYGNGRNSNTNEVAIQRENDGKRVMPDFIVGFINGDENDERTMAELKATALEFGVPIVLIDERTYNKAKDERLAALQSGNIDSLSIDDIDFIFETQYKIAYKMRLALNVADQLLNSSKLTPEAYLELIGRMEEHILNMSPLDNNYRLLTGYDGNKEIIEDQGERLKKTKQELEERATSDRKIDIGEIVDTVGTDDSVRLGEIQQIMTNIARTAEKENKQNQGDKGENDGQSH